MKTPPMFYPQEDGKLVEIPEEHAAILELYRDRMPVCYEVQETGQPLLYALIDVDEEPYGTPQPGTLETAALRVARALKAQRLGNDLVPVDYRVLAHAAIRAHVADIAEFTAACAYDEPEARRQRYAGQEARRIGRQLTKTVESAVNAATPSTKKVSA
ncbi:hypothetical protein [Streptomyces sp. NBC_01092]|uniref:hypothetical protein n=1 Tax=Streptomyces sp. NBC_01092 TaxID=2903748 RepID=UPI00386E7E9D|nr:hypothetical protein OG254_12395 [Streptomyces sp. NBC_01092]